MPNKQSIKDNHSQWIFFKERFKALSKALKLQATEYKRRLKDLNGEAGRLRSMQQNYIPREVFDRMVENIEKRIDDIENWKTKQDGRTQLLQYIPWVIAVIAIIASWYKK